MFKPLSSLLPESLNRLRVRRPVEATIVCRATDKAIGELWDHAVPMRSVSYKGGIVTVAVTSSSWAHEVLTRGEAIKEKVSAELGGAPVKQVKTRVAPNAARGEDQPLY